MGFDVIELRRYTIRPGERRRFAEYFDAYFPEAIQQLGAIAAGQFLERTSPDGFTWIRAFRTMDDRAWANANLYYGPVWNEHKATMNGLMVDSDNVLLLRPVDEERPILVMPAVDPMREAASDRGLVVAQILAVEPQRLNVLIGKAAPLFARYRAAGIREAAMLVTLDAPNNFPQLPVRTDGPFVVWMGVMRDDAGCRRGFEQLAAEVAQELSKTDALRGVPEVLMLEPTRRSRLRWLEEWDEGPASAG